MPAEKRHLPAPPSSAAPDDDAGQPPAADPRRSPSLVSSPPYQQVGEEEEPRREMTKIDGGVVGHDEEEMEAEAEADTQPPAPPLQPPRPGEQKQEEEEDEKPFRREPAEQRRRKDDSEGGRGGYGVAEDDGADDDELEEGDEKEEFIQVKLADVRREVQCPICLGIIRKTRTVMECLHRFCRECIDKSMRLGNNECPACRTHCASRRSLRDDPNYDALIAILYPDIDKYEEEELAFRDEEQSRNKKIQAAIAETIRRQTEAIGRKRYTAKATAEAFVRRSQGTYRSRGQINHLRKRSRSGNHENMHAASEDEDHDDDELEANGNDGSKESSSADEPSPDRMQKRCKRPGAARPSPARSGSADVGFEETDDLEAIRENTRKSSLQSGNREMLAAWGKNGARSQTRHGSTSGSNGRIGKGGRMAKLVDYLRSGDEKEDEYDVHLTLVSLNEESIPNLQQPYICCRPTLSIRHICEFIAFQTCVQAEEVQLYARKPQDGRSASKSPTSDEKCHANSLVGLQILEGQESLAALSGSFITDQGEMVLEYSLKVQSQKTA